MNLDNFDVDDLQPGQISRGPEGMRGKEGDVLVVHRVKLTRHKHPTLMADNCAEILRLLFRFENMKKNMVVL